MRENGVSTEGLARTKTQMTCARSSECAIDVCKIICIRLDNSIFPKSPKVLIEAMEAVGAPVRFRFGV